MPAIKNKVDLNGHDKLRNALREMPIEVAKVGLRKAVNAGSQPIVKAYRSNLPNVSGQMRKAVTKKTKFYKRSGTYAAIIGADRNKVGTRRGRRYVPGNIVQFFEGGVRPHTIVPTKGPWVGRTLRHPGFAAQHDLQRAVEATAGQVTSAMSAKLAEAVEAAAAKHA